MFREVIEGFTIDGPSTQDHDDALTAEERPDGSLRFLISIADVASQVPIGSLVDQAAAEKGFSFYFPQAVRPMLPYWLSHDRLSLVAEAPRLAVTLALPIDGAGQAGTPTFLPTIVVSRARLTYAAADQLVTDASDPIGRQLRRWAELAQRLRRHRTPKGTSLVDDLARGVMLTEEGDERVLKNSERHISYLIVQEAMVLYNRLLAEWCQIHGVPVLYRNHQPLATPPIDETAREQPSVTGLVGLKSGYHRVALGHKGLGLASYLHATSPIRRFADVIVQRMLLAWLAGQPLPYTETDLDQMALAMNQAELRIKRQYKSAHYQEVDRLIRQALATDSFTNFPDHWYHLLLREMRNERNVSPQLVVETQTRLLAGRLSQKAKQVLLDKVGRSLVWQPVANLLKPDRALSLTAITQPELGVRGKYRPAIMRDAWRIVLGRLPGAETMVPAAIRHLRDSGYVSKELLNFLRETEGVGSLTYTGQPLAGGIYMTRLLITLEDQRVIESRDCFGETRRVAESRARKNVLAQLLDTEDDVLEEEIFLKNQRELAERCQADLRRSYPKAISVLHTYAQRQQLRAPMYVVSQVAPKIWEANVTLADSQGRLLTVAYQMGATAKQAKRAAASSLIRSLLSELIVEPGQSYSPLWPQPASVEHGPRWINLLHTRSVRLGLKAPKISYKRQGDQIHCSYTVPETTHDQVTFVASGSTRDEALLLAARVAYEAVYAA